MGGSPDRDDALGDVHPEPNWIEFQLHGQRRQLLVRIFNFTTTVCYAGDGVATDGFFEVVSTCSGGKYYTQIFAHFPSNPTDPNFTDIVYDSNGPQDVGVAAANLLTSCPVAPLLGSLPPAGASGTVQINH